MSKEDDGRVIADMSGVERPALFRFHSVKREEEQPRAASDLPKESLSWRDRLICVRAAMTASLLIALAYIVGLGLLGWLLLTLWS